MAGQEERQRLVATRERRSLAAGHHEVLLVGRQRLRENDRRRLACSLIGPADTVTLPARMVAFLFVHRAAVERHAERRNFSVTSILASVWPGAVPIWRRLVEDDDGN